MKKRFATTLLSAALIGSMLTTAPMAVQAEDNYELVIELMTFGPVPADIEKVETAISEITSEKIGATVKFLPISVADHATKVNLLAAGGEKVDLIMSGITGDPATLYGNGVLTDLTELIDEYAPSLKEEMGDLLNACTYNGGIYAIPGVKYPGEKLNLLYNKDMAEEYGIEIPETLNGYEEWDAFFAQCKEKLPEGIYPFTLGDGSGSSTLNWDSAYDSLGDTSYLAYGVLAEVETGTELVNWYETEKYQTMLEKRHEWYENGYVVPDSMTSGYSTLDCMGAGTCFAFQNAFKADCNEVTLGRNCGGLNLGYIPLSDAIISGSSTCMMSWGVPVTSEQPEKAVQFMELLFSDAELANICNFGIEGEHYVKESDRIVNYPEGKDAMSNGWGGFINWFGDNEKVYQFAPNTEEYFDQLPSYSKEEGIVSNALGYTFDNTSVKTQLAAVTSVIDTMKPALECGLVSVEEELPNFIQALKDAGIDEIIAENQAQFDAWLAAK
ncbi:MAG: ABC transporter substrate-binding protein [Blautia sp.]|nr:ABC transporter substrate-binding protein [Blautia sp.]